MLKKEVTFSLKDQLFNKDKILYLSDMIFKGADQCGFDFDKDNFVKDCVRDFKNLELKERISHITKTINKYFLKSANDDSNDKYNIDSHDKYNSNKSDNDKNNKNNIKLLNYKYQVKVLIKSLPKELDNNKEDDDFGDFILAPIGEYISVFGIENIKAKSNQSEKDEILNISLDALREITKRFSCEYPVRDFINNFTDESLHFLLKCSLDNNYHVRRFASESTRGKLPWAVKINVSYKDKRILQILDNLYKDKTMYVRRSVANHLHDISKIDKDLTLKILSKWKKDKAVPREYIDFIIRHSLRTLIKNGDKDALNFININPDPKIKTQIFNINNSVINEVPNIKVGEALDFDFGFKSMEKENTEYSIKYIIHFRNPRSQSKNIKSYSPKVFNLKNITLQYGEVFHINKKHKIVSMTTRALYMGEHILEIKVNGQSCGIIEWNLEV